MPGPTIAVHPSHAHDDRWPALPLAEWGDTRDTLQLWGQLAGKLKVELSPFQNQLWQTAFQLTARGLTTGTIPFASFVFQVDFDFVDHNVEILTSKGGRKAIPLYPRSVAHFYDELMGCLTALDIDVRIDPMPQEVPNPISCAEDTIHASYDANAVNCWWRIATSSARVMWQHRAWFTGKASPVHFFWGGFDLAMTRHNGEPNPFPPRGSYIFRVAENEKNWAGGFWTGGDPIDFSTYYAYMVPKPDGLEDARVEPAAAFWSPELGEILLPYDAVRAADDPEATLMAFFQSTYAVSADLAGWDRERLEIKEIPRPR
jgi:hypothetical protein